MSKRGSRIVYLVGVLWLYSFVAGGSLYAQGVSFVARRDFAAGDRPTSVAVGDFNGDGIQDLAVANRGDPFNPSNVSVLLGNGDGTFQTAVSFGTGVGPVSVAVGDFNGDGIQDLAVANNGSSNVSVLINNTP